MSVSSVWQTMYSNLDSRSRYFFDDMLREIPVVGAWLKASDQVSFYDDYLKNRNMDWGDIKYHSAKIGVGAATKSTVNFVSKNVGKLYR